MVAFWKFEGGRLVARNPAGTLLWSWLADESMGQPLADVLNQAQDLSRLLLHFVTDDPFQGLQGTQSVKAVC